MTRHKKTACTGIAMYNDANMKTSTLKSPTMIGDLRTMNKGQIKVNVVTKKEKTETIYSLCKAFEINGPPVSNPSPIQSNTIS